MLSTYVGDVVLPGLVSLVSHAGETRVQVLGRTAFDGPPMQRDSLFRVASFTKPIVAAAAMVLVDELRLSVDRPVDDLLPELAGMRVLRQPDGVLDDTVAMDRPITLRDLLTFRLGLGESDNPAIRQREDELGLRTFGPPVPRTSLGPDEWMRRFGTVPLQYQPGERWMYSTGSHVLGVLIARVTGQPLEEFLRERLFEPLRMRDTGFTASDPARLTTAYVGDDVLDPAAASQWLEPPSFPDASGGLISTADDFHAFARMLLTGGDGILSPAAVAEMTTDHLTPAQRTAAADYLGPDTGWGYGLSVSPDRYGWAGGLGTLWSTTPAEGTISILLTQRALWTWPEELFAEASAPAW
ncbi:class A beta-lactamase-related serine hydrolase [Kribbella turkmenica]|uniref:Class A beta-lactamase-related serine hydrolase n=1 Tax=Kribbella turkmenica TaxID=2530375 RepID=A0A4R4XDX0_9ACTN|nr:serine hydrolase domain-containing protein [Kribbella turkmenica]TDD29001.1 class A beta-lactamase-related serine hydrolase [Kribbella turkmenica]